MILLDTENIGRDWKYSVKHEAIKACVTQEDPQFWILWNLTENLKATKNYTYAYKCQCWWSRCCSNTKISNETSGCSDRVILGSDKGHFRFEISCFQKTNKLLRESGPRGKKAWRVFESKLTTFWNLIIAAPAAMLACMSNVVWLLLWEPLCASDCRSFFTFF